MAGCGTMKFDVQYDCGGVLHTRIKGFPNYKVGEDGSIKNKKGRIVKGSKNSQGYVRVKLSNGSIKKDLYVHRIVAIHFLNCPGEEYEVHHKNNQRDDSRVINLQWVTRQENMKHVHGWKNRKWIEKTKK